MTIRWWLLSAVTAVHLASISDDAIPGQAESGSAAPAEKPKFKQEELDQLLAPIALHPDDLLSQILIASTYPIEIVQADRWIKSNASLTGDALAKALEEQPWDPSVKSLVNVPQVLTMMGEKLDWMVSLGNAFLGQQKEVMVTIQKLRAKAKEAGNLATTKEQEVTTESQAGTEVIVIESASPEVIYVPVYSPTVVYGSWWYPAYPPYYWYPPGYVAGPGVYFGAGVAIGVAWGYAWGHCGWGNCDVDIDVNRNTNINRNIDRGKYATQLENRGVRNGKGSWQHDPAHQQGVAYRDSATAKRLGSASSADASKARDAFRGRADSAATQPARSGASASDRSPASATTRSPASPSTRSSASDRATSSSRASALSGVRDGGSAARSASSRGSASRASSGGGRSRGGGGGRGRRG